jgi:drug/metabolite transporter (DMT)-like permease
VAAARTNIGPFLIFCGAMLWATDAPFRVALLEHLSPQLLVFGEHLINVVLLLPLLFLRRREILRLPAADWGVLLFIGVAGSALATFMFTKAFAYVNPSVAILLQKLQPFIAICLAHVWLGERQGKKFWIWALLAIAGAYVLSFPDLVPRVYEGETFNPNLAGSLLALGAAALWGAATVFGKRALAHVDSTTVTVLRFWIAFVFLAALTSWTGDLPLITSVAPRDWLLILIVACVSGAFSLLLYYRGLKTTPASVATIAELGFPLAAVVINVIVLHAWLKPMEVVGMCALLCAVYALSRDKRTNNA